MQMRYFRVYRKGDVAPVVVRAKDHEQAGLFALRLCQQGANPMPSTKVCELVPDKEAGDGPSLMYEQGKVVEVQWG